MRFISDIIRDNHNAACETDREADVVENTLSEFPDTDNPVTVDDQDPSGNSYLGEQGHTDLNGYTWAQPDEVRTDHSMSAEIDQVVADMHTEDASAEEDGEFELENYFLSEGIARIDPFDRLTRSDDARRDAAHSVGPFARSAKIQPPVDPAPSFATVSSKNQFETSLDDLEILDDFEAFLPSEGDTEPMADGGGKQPARARTRLLGFTAAEFQADDPFERARNGASQFPVGWLVVISDLGRGACFILKDGVSTIGRGDDQAVCLDFGDNSVSRKNHASVAYDAEQRRFFVGHGGKTNLVRLNDAPLLSTEQLSSGDCIRLGQTTLKFVAFCGETFSWNAQPEKAAGRA